MISVNRNVVELNSSCERGCKQGERIDVWRVADSRRVRRGREQGVGREEEKEENKWQGPPVG